MSDVLVTNDVIDDIHSYAAVDPHANCQYKTEVESLKLENKELRNQNGHLQRQLTVLQKKLNDLLSGYPIEPSSMAATKTIVQNHLELTGYFSSAQTNELFKRADGVKNPKCHDWQYSDYSKAITIKNYSLNALLDVRTLCVPLPAASTLHDKFKFMHLVPGPIRSVLIYLENKAKRLSRVSRLCSITFDETRLVFK